MKCPSKQHYISSRKVTKDVSIILITIGKESPVPILIKITNNNNSNNNNNKPLLLPTVNAYNTIYRTSHGTSPNPSLLPHITTNPFVVTKLLRGAHLYEGGIHDTVPSSLPPPGAAVAVLCEGAVVGTGAYDGRDVRVWSCWGDRVCEEYEVEGGWEGVEKVETRYGEGVLVREEVGAGGLGSLKVYDLGFGSLFKRSEPPAEPSAGEKIRALEKAVARTLKERKSGLPLPASTVYSESLRHCQGDVNAKAAGFAGARDMLER